MKLSVYKSCHITDKTLMLSAVKHAA